jgi:HAE1 family hydrophobic/amphiphilic exporter-1
MTRLAAALTAAALLAAPASAPSAAPPVSPPVQPEVRVLTLEEALQLASQRNFDILRAAEYGRSVRGRYVEERAAALPRLSLDAYYSKAEDETQNVFFPPDAGFAFPTKQTVKSASLSLDQALFTWGKVGAALRAAKYGIESAADVNRLARQAARREVTAAFHDVLLAKELSAIARQNLEQRERHLDEARRKFALGTATDYDVLAADVGVQNARPVAIRTENAVTIARDRLRYLLAEAADVDVRGDLAASAEPVPAFTEALETALRERSDLAELTKRKQVYGELVKIAKAGNKPRLDLAGSYGFKDLDLGMLQGDGAIWSAGIYLSFPFFNGLATQGRVQQAVSDFNTEDIALRQLREQISLEIRVALSEVHEAGEISEALSGTVREAERLLAMAEKGFQLGVKTRLEVDDAQLNLAQAQGNLAGARRDLLVAQTNLKFVMGVL